MDNFQKFEGYVIEVIHRDWFIANIKDLTCPGMPDEQVEIDMKIISIEDRPLVVPGTIFDWIIKPGIGSIIIFRLLPKWTAKELEEAKNKAKKLSEWFNFD